MNLGVKEDTQQDFNHKRHTATRGFRSIRCVRLRSGVRPGAFVVQRPATTSPSQMEADAATAAGSSLLTPTVVEATVTLPAAPGAPASPVPGNLEAGIADVEDFEHDEPEGEDDLCNADADTIPGVPGVGADVRLLLPAPAATSPQPLDGSTAAAMPTVVATADASNSVERRLDRLEARFSVLKRKAAEHFGELEKQIDAAYDVASLVNRKVIQLADYAQETRHVVKRLAAAAKLPTPQS